MARLHSCHKEKSDRWLRCIALERWRCQGSGPSKGCSTKIDRPMSLFHSRKSQPEAAARADHNHSSPNTRSWIAFNARQRAFRCPRYWARLTQSAIRPKFRLLEQTYLEVSDGEALYPRSDRWSERMRLRSHPAQSEECVEDHDGELPPVLPRLKALSIHNQSKFGPRGPFLKVCSNATGIGLGRRMAFARSRSHGDGLAFGAVLVPW
ncbi:hypothetical protein ASPFODRAFT_52129 [Aspergillus luchuensis CBS 106.47]|uniref:Uncharacterized protein n=1 Tax=Aspergillus luchuensis (strain CBS 106.47) TaxID=1137211 RepID=A0A1M3T309_ASPLC|nr:hypothetical protein ASPFODRAFT_52129 [Aspergillus luchuensis CBS 106.47]